MSVEDSIVHLACASGTEGQPGTVTEHTSVDLPPGIVLHQRIQKKEEFSKLVATGLSLLKHKPSTVVLGLPAGLVLTLAKTGLTESPTAKKPLASLVSEAIPLPAEKLQIKDQWNAPSGKNPGVWSCVAIEHDVLEEYKAALKGAGLSSVKVVPLSLAFLAVHASSATVDQPTLVLNLTTHPGSIMRGSRSIMLDERLLFDATLEESLTETLETWAALLPKETKTSMIALGDEAKTKALLTKILAKNPSVSLTTKQGDEWTYAAMLASAELAKPSLPSF